MQNSKKILVSAILFLLACSCSRKDKIILAPETSNSSQLESNEVSQKSISDITVTNGMLYFENHGHLINCLNVLSTMADDDKIKWASSIGHVSPMNKFYEAQSELRKIELEYPNIDSDENDFENFKTKIAGVRDRYKDFLTIDELGNITDKVWIDPNYSWISNINNCFKIGNSLVFLDNRYYIEVSDGNYSKLESAKNNPITNSSLGIYCYQVEKKKITSNTRGAWSGNLNMTNPSINYNLASSSAETQSGTRYKTSIYLYIFAIINTSGTTLTHNLIVDGYNQKKALVGWAATYAPSTVSSGTYYTPVTAPPPQKIHYYYFSLSSPFYTIYSQSQTFSGVSFYQMAFGYKTVTNSSTNQKSYNFRADFTTVGTHHSGKTATTSL